jgi:hypothetical protein
MLFRNEGCGLRAGYCTPLGIRGNYRVGSHAPAYELCMPVKNGVRNIEVESLRAVSRGELLS